MELPDAFRDTCFAGKNLPLFSLRKLLEIAQHGIEEWLGAMSAESGSATIADPDRT